MILTLTVDYYIRRDSRNGSIEQVVVCAAHEGATRQDPCTVTAGEIDFLVDITVCILRKLRAHIYLSPVEAALLSGS